MGKCDIQGPLSPIVDFIKCKFMMTTIMVTLANGEVVKGEVVDAFDSLIGLAVGKGVVFINAEKIVTFVQAD